MKIELIMEKQRALLASGLTESIHYRISMLKRLSTGVKTYQDRMIECLKADLNKGEIEAILSEIWFVQSEIKLHIRKLSKWVKPKRVKTPLFLKPGKSYQIAVPLGLNLIMSPWNYPFQLALVPLIGAISSGGTAILRPSMQTPSTSALLEKMISELFDEDYIAVINGDHLVAEQLLENKFDHIFFTGSTRVGQKILKIASQDFTKVTLELGGKSPAIIHNVTRIDIIAKRIAYGKILNAGQTCIAPDYLIVHHSMVKSTINALNHYFNELLGPTPLENEDYPRIISEHHFARLVKLLENEEIVGGGAYHHRTLKIAPTLVKIASLDSPLMQEEIFGPILPIIEYTDEEEIKPIIDKNPHPLALYIFSENKHFNQRMIKMIQSGGVTVNDCLSHVVNPHLPFGGIHQSGIGSYHGYQSFLTFSHQKSVYERHPRYETKMKYPPYTDKNKKIIRKLFK